ncbi:portal protein, partial [Citrobacter amalonaticus]
QQLEDVTAIERLGANVANLAVIDQEVVDLVDTDEATRVVADALGVPAKVIRSTDAVADLRERRRKSQAEAQQQALMMQAGSEAAGAAGQTAGAALGKQLAGG